MTRIRFWGFEEIQYEIGKERMKRKMNLEKRGKEPD